MERNGTPKYTIKSTMPRFARLPLSERSGNKKVRIPEGSIYANRTTRELNLTLSPCMHSVSDAPVISTIDADYTVISIKNFAAKEIQIKMRKYFEKFPLVVDKTKKKTAFKKQ